LPDSSTPVAIELKMKSIRFGRGDLLPKHVLSDCMTPFSNVERSDWRAFGATQELVGCRGVNVFQIKGDEEAGIGVSRQ
jgi:hypothetical protein